ncbi:hypothetical protein AMAG_14806 [Allomyces macrogynus ATCC 38327]|uniref:Uncharacterized protein n=1 Tax=Allomyces macrogynus (strain ATCC 38327) TaxID=578462 RepID=A0A0L0T5B8_ALLM3|nr:hypothetical protein AMAG_14806 [Allomyces macrogynus ATCC 38327]|eukprot:KNE69968.1 hypothetical protein AMAG_14806 [Allomyces macrogynus ATCC 38327]
MGPPRTAAPNAPSPLSSVQTAKPTPTRSRSTDPTAPSAPAPYKPLPQAQSRPRAASVPSIPPRLPTMASATSSRADMSVAAASSSPVVSPPVIMTPAMRTASPALGGGPYTARWHQWTTSSSISESDDATSHDEGGRGKGHLTDSGHASSADSIPAGTVIAIRTNSNDTKLPAVSTPVIQAQPLPSAAPAVDSATAASAATPNPAATVATPGSSSTRRPGSETPAREPRSVLSLAAASSLDDLVAQLCVSGRPPAIPSSATASSDSMAPASTTPDASRPDADTDTVPASTTPADTAAVMSPTPRALDLYLPPLTASLDRSLSLPRGVNTTGAGDTVPDVPVPTPAPADHARPTRPTLAIPPPPSASPPPTAASTRAPTLPTPPTSAAPPAAAASPTAAAKDYYQLVHARRISSTPGSPPATSTSLVARRASAADAAAVVSRAVDAVEARVDDRLAQLADENAALRAHVDRVVEELAETQRVHQAMLRDLYAKLEAVQVRDRLLMQHVEEDGAVRDRAWSRASSSGSMVAATSSAGSVRGRAMSLESNAVGSVVSSAVAASVRGSGSVPRASSGLAVSAAATGSGKKKRSLTSPFSSRRNSFASSMASSSAVPPARASFSVSGASTTSHRSSWAKISNVAKAVMGLKHGSRRGSAATTASTTAPSTRRGSSPLIHSTTLPATSSDTDDPAAASARDWTHDATLLRALAYHARVLTACDRAAHDLAAVAARYATVEPQPPTVALTTAVGRAAATLWRVLARWPRAKVQEVAAVDGEDERDEDAFEAAIEAGRWPRAATDDESWEMHEMVAAEHQRIDRAVREVLGVVDDAVLARVAARLARLALALAVVVRLVMPDVAMYARAPADAAVDDSNEVSTEYEPAWHRPADGVALPPEGNAVVESVVFPGLTTDPPLMVLAKSRVLLASPLSTTLRAIPAAPAPPSPSPTTPELDAIQTFRRVYALAVRLVDLTLAPAAPPTSDPNAIARLIEVSRLVDARRSRAAALRGISAALVAAQDRVAEGMDAVHAQLASALPAGVTAGDARARRTRAALLKDMTRVVVLGGGAARTRVFEAVLGEAVDRKVHSVRADDGARTEAVVGSGMVVAAPVFGGLMRESAVAGERGKVLVKCRVTAAASVRGSFVGPATTPMLIG